MEEVEKAVLFLEGLEQEEGKVVALVNVVTSEGRTYQLRVKTDDFMYIAGQIFGQLFLNAFKRVNENTSD